MVSVLIHIILLIFSIILSVVLFFKRKFSYWKDRKIPYLEPVIPFGNLEGVGTTKHIRHVIDEVYTTFKGKTLYAGAYYFFTPVVIVTDLDLLKNIMIKDFSYFPDRPVYYNDRDDPLSAHMFNIDGARWRHIRAKISPTFTGGKMKFLYPTVLEVTNRLIKTLSKESSECPEVEFRELFGRFTSDVIGTCAFGLECNSLNNPNSEFRMKGRKIFLSPRHSEYFRFFIETFPNLARTLRIKLENDDVSEFFINVVKETVDYREKNKIRRNDFMDLLIQLKNTGMLDGSTEKIGKITIREIAAEVYVFFSAGFETSSSALSLCLYELALQPNLQDKAREEVFRVLKKYNNEMTYEAVMEMTYLHQLISETLRLYPSLTFLNRRTEKNYLVPDTKHVIEKGTTILIPLFSIQRDPDIYPNPDAFNPDNFLPEAVSARHPLAAMPFGEGPRNCIGLRFGKMQTYTALAEVLRNFRFKPSKNTEIPLKFENGIQLLTPTTGIYLTAEKYTS